MVPNAFDISIRLDVDHECDGRTDGRTEPALIVDRSNAKKLIGLYMSV